MKKFSGNKGVYHIALIVTATTALNWALINLLQINLVARIFSGFSVPGNILAIIVCISAILVLWHNWVD